MRRGAGREARSWGDGCQALRAAGWAFPSRATVEGAIFHLEKTQRKAEPCCAAESPRPQPRTWLSVVCPSSPGGPTAGCVPARHPAMGLPGVAPALRGGWQSPGGNQTSLKLLPCLHHCCCRAQAWAGARPGEAGLAPDSVPAAVPGTVTCSGCGPRWGCNTACQGAMVQRAGGSWYPSLSGSTQSPAASITPRTATCPVQTPAAVGGHGAFPVEVSEQRSLHSSCLPRKSLQWGC